jgi:acetyltransferase
MSVKGLEGLFDPHAIAVVGAGAAQDQVGHIVLRNLVEGDFPGVVYPVNTHRAAVSGIRAYATIADLPCAVDLAVICTPATTVPGLVRECGEQGVGALAVLSAGFREAGSEGKELEEQLRSELAGFSSLRLLGPNCLGLLVPQRSLNASFGGVMPAAGQLAFVSQSGALATAIIDWARSEGIGFSHVITLGNMLDVDVADVIDYLGQDQTARGLILYVESVTNSRRFMSAARAFARNRPIIVYKAGRFAASAQAAFSHTGALVSRQPDRCPR